ncbi:MAG: imidazole glycerol phosphate synthase subunit HisH [Clostridia bacterium]|nr:imidazole glycerol phosphate synthase subunit HisH [Clostridia bacterium]MBP5592685.1 imidazole glycerol phosphate synthase subunit HisH [Clostridia bacterium]MBP5648422.1 imidazole glycerol phosphate synthase subunit HisH [Clostridia bacterium]
MTAIADYGVGNLFSLKCSFASIGEDAVITTSPDVLFKADRIVLPGVGAFRDAANKLRLSGLDKVIISEANSGKPLLGICLGMQMLFEKSYEYGVYEGLGLLKGSIQPISGVIQKGLKIPHMGWNPLIFVKDSKLFKYIKEGECMYFVHSYYAKAEDDSVSAVAEYGAPLTAAVEKNNIFGCQFHPEKSGDAGLKILKAFAETEAIK